MSNLINARGLGQTFLGNRLANRRKGIRAKMARAVAVALVGSLGQGAMAGVADNWTGLADGLAWGTGGNWGGGTPTAGSDAIFPTPVPLLTTGPITLGGGALANSMTFADTYTFTSGDLTLTTLGTDALSGNVTVAATKTVTFDTSTVLAGTLSGINKLGTGTLVLAGSNTYTGNTTLTAGTLAINNSSALGNAGSSTFIIGGGTIDNTSGSLVTMNDYVQQWNADFSFAGTNDLNMGNGAVTLNATRQVNVSAGNLTVGGAIGGAAGFGLTKAGGGVMILSGANTYAGPTVINTGKLQIGAGSNSGSLATGSAITVAGGATLAYFRNDSSTISNVINGTGTIQLDGTGGSIQSSYNFTGNMSGFTGAINLNQSRFQGSNANQNLGSSVIMNVNDGSTAFLTGGTYSNTFNVSGQGWQETAGLGKLGALRLQGSTISGTVNLLGDTRISSYGGNGTISGNIGGNFGVEIYNDTAARQVTFSGVNTYTGRTNLTVGDLIVASNTALGTNDAEMNLLTLTARYLINGGVTVPNNFVINGNNPAVGNGTIQWNGVAGSGPATLTGTITVNATAAAGGTLRGGASAVDALVIAGAFNASVTTSQRDGFVTFAGGGNVSGVTGGTNITNFSATTVSTLGANDGMPTFFAINLGTSGVYTLNMAGFNQTLGGMTRTAANAATIQNTGNTFSTLTLNVPSANTYTNTGGGIVLGSSGAANINVVKLDSGTQDITGANLYTGLTTITGGTLITGTVAAAGQASGLGASLANPNNVVMDGTTLRFTGAGGITDRSFTVGTNGATIEASGTAAVNFAGPGAIALAGTDSGRTITLGGTSTALNTMGLTIGDNGTGGTSLTKTGAGVWVINAANTYTGATSVNGGTLQYNVLPTNIGPGAISVNAGAVTSGITGGLNQAMVDKVSTGSTGVIGLGNTNSANAIDLSAYSSISFGANGTATYSGVLTPNGQVYRLGGGTGTLTFASKLVDLGGNPTDVVLDPNGTAGTVVLTNANTYTGVTTVGSSTAAMTLRIANQNALGTGAGNTVVANGSNIRLDPGLIVNENLVGNGTSTTQILTLPAGNAEWAGNINVNTVGNRVASNGSGTLTLSGVISGTSPGQGLTIRNVGSNSAAILGNLNTFDGPMFITGRVTINSLNSVTSGTTVGGPSSFGTPSSAANGQITLGVNTAGVEEGTIIYTGPAVTTDRSVGLNGVNTTNSGGATIMANGTGAMVFTTSPGGGSLPSANINQGFNLSGTSTAANEWQAPINDLFSGGTNSIILSKSGPGTWQLTRSNTYSGGTNVNAGTLRLDFSSVGAPTSDILNSSTGIVTVAGGTLEINGGVGLSNSQNMPSATVGAGASRLVFVQNGATDLSANLNAVTRNVGGTVDITLPTTGTVSTSTGNTNGILGGGATVGGNTWAVGGGAISGLAAGSYTKTSVALAVAANYLNVNADIDSAATVMAAAITPNSIRLNTALATTTTLTGTNTITTGGILETSTVGAFASTITGGTIIPAASQDLIVIQNNPSSTLTIASIIGNSTTAPAGRTGNTATNTTISGLSNTNDLFIGKTITGTGIPAGATITAINSPTSVTISAATTATATGVAITFGANSGLTKSGAGTLILSAANTYTGPTYVNGGALQVTTVTAGGTAGQLGGAASAVNTNLVLNGGTINVVTAAAQTTDRLFTLGLNGGTIGNTGGAFALTFSGTGALLVAGTGDRTLTLQATTAAQNNVFAPVIPDVNAAGAVFSGWTSLTKTGVGNWILTGNNTFSGTTLVSQGTLSIGNNGTTGSLGQGAASIASGAILNFNRSDNITSNNYISGAGALTKTGAGILTLNGLNTFSGTTTISAGTVLYATPGGTALLNGVATPASSFSPNSTVTVSTATTAGFGFALSQAQVAKFAAGSAGAIALGLDSANNLDFNAPTLTGVTLGSLTGTSSILSGTLTPASVGYRLGGGTGGTLWVTSPLTSAGNLVVAANGTTTGTVVLTGNNTGLGTTSSVTGGVLVYGTGASYGTLAAGGLTLPSGGSAGLGVAMDQTFVGKVGTGGAGVLALGADSANNLNFSGANLAGVSLGAVNVAANSAGTAFAGPYTFSGTLTPNGTTYRLGGGAGTLVFNSIASGAANSLVVGGSGSGGTVILPTANTYGAGTTVTAGSTLQIGNAGTTGSVTGAIVSNGTVSYNRTDLTTVPNAIAGTGGLTISSATGTVSLPNNAFAGPMTLNSGVSATANFLSIGTESSGIGSGTNAAGNLVLDGSTLQYTGSKIAISDRLFTLGGTTTAAGTTISATGAPLQLTNTGALAYTGTGARTLTLAGTAGNALVPSTFGAVLADSGGISYLNKTGTGTWALLGTGTYTGLTTISGGTLMVGNNTTTGALPTGAVMNNGSLVFARSTDQGMQLNIYGTGSVTKQFGAGVQTLNGNQFYTGGTVINSGQLYFQGSGAIPNTGLVTIASGAFLGANYAVDQVTLNKINPASTGVLYMNAASNLPLDFNTPGLTNVGLGTNTAQTYSGTITPAGSTYRLGAGAALTVSSALTGGGNGLVVGGNVLPGTVILTGTNTYGGTTTIQPTANPGSGQTSTLQIGTGGTAGTLGAGAVIDNGFLTFNRSDAITASNNISGTGQLTQSGAGNLILSGANTYTGWTQVNSGILTLANAGALSAGTTINVAQGAAVAMNFDPAGLANISTLSRGVLGLGANSAVNLDFTGRPNLGLGASANASYSGTITPANGVYRLGGGSGTTLGTTFALTVSSPLGGGNSLVVGSGLATNAFASGTVSLTGTNTLTGGVTVVDGALVLSGTGSLLNLSATAGNQFISLRGSGYSRSGAVVTGVATRTGAMVLVGDGTDRLGTTGIGLNGGEFVYAQAAGGPAASYTLTNLTANSGQSWLSVSPLAGAGPAVLTVTNFARNGAAALDFRTYAGTLGGAGTGDGQIVIAGLPANTNGIIGGWATAGGTTWAVNTAGSVSGLAAGSYGVNTYTAGTNADVTAASTQTGITVNSLRIGNTASITLTLAGTNVVTSGGVLFTGSTTAATIAGTSLTSGLANTVGGNDLYVVANGANAATLNAVVANNGAVPLRLIKTGDAGLTLGAANTMTGGTVVDGGTLTVNNVTGLGAISTTFNSPVNNAVTVASGATLLVNGLGGTANQTAQWSATIAGNGFNNQGAIGYNGGTSNSQQNLLRSVTLSADATISLPTNRIDVRPNITSGPSATPALNYAGFLNLAGNTLTKNGANQLSFVGVGRVSAGNIVINAGTASIEQGTAVPAIAGSSITVNGPTGKLGLFEGTLGMISIGRDINLVNGGAFGHIGATAFRPISSNIALLGTADGVIDPSSGPMILTGTISGNAGLNKTGGFPLTLSGTNTYTGATTISANILSTNTLADGNLPSGIGASGQAANNLFINGGTLRYTGASAGNTNRLFTVGATGATLDASGAGALNFSNTGNIALYSTGSRTITLDGTNVGNLSAGITDQGVNYTSLVKNGVGSWSIGGTNSYTGPTTVNGGVLVVDYSNGTNKLSATSPVTLNGGRMFIAGQGATAQSVNGLIIGSGGASSMGVVGATLTVGQITNLPGSAVNWNLSGGGVVATTSANGSGAILGGFATVDDNTFARVNAGTIVGLASYSGTIAAGNDVSLTATTDLSAPTSFNSLRVNTPSSLTISTNSALTNSSGGVLVTAAVGNNSLVIRGGTLSTAPGNDLNFHLNNTGTTIVQSQIGDTTNNAGFALTKTGPGTLFLQRTTAAGNPFTGAVGVFGGTLQFLGNGNADLPILGAGPKAITVNGGSVQLVGASYDPNALNKFFVVGPQGAGFNIDRGLDLLMNDAGQLVSSATGIGALTKTGDGRVLLNSQAFAFNGPTSINGGILQVNNAGSLGTGTTADSTVTINGGTLDANSTAASFTFSKYLVVQGKGFLNQGALANLGTANTATISGPVTLSGGAAPSIGGAAALAITGPISSTVGLTKVGANTTTISGISSISGATTVLGGTLNLDFQTVNFGIFDTTLGAYVPGKIDSTQALNLSGGGLTVRGNQTANTVQIVNGVSLGLGANSLTASSSSTAIAAPNVGVSTTLDTRGGIVGAPGSSQITRSGAGSTLNFTLTTGSAGNVPTINVANANTNGILGGWATIGNTDWATVAAGAIGTATYGAAYAANENTSLTATASAPAAFAINSLRIAPAAATVLTLSGANSIASGGILISTGAFASTISGGSITTASGELIFQDNAPVANITTVNSQLIGAMGLTKSGVGQLTLTNNANSSTGTINVNAGILQANGLATLGTQTNAINLNGGQLNLRNDVSANYGGVVSVLPTLTGTATITVDQVTAVNQRQQIGIAGLNIGYQTLAVTAGTAANGATLAINGPVVLSGDATLNPTNSDLFVNGTVSGAFKLTLAGVNAAVMAGQNTYSGDTFLNGVAQVSASSTVSGGNLVSGPLGTGTVRMYLGAGTLRSDNFARTLNNGLVLSGNNGTYTFTGAANPSATYPMAIAQGGLTFSTTGLTTAAGVTLIDPNPTIAVGATTLTFDMAVTGNAITKTGGGTLVLARDNPNLNGTITVNQGVVQANTIGALGNTLAPVVVNTGGTLAAGFAPTPAFLARVAPTSGGAIALTSSTANNLDFAAAGLTAASLGATTAVTYTGTLTPSGNVYRLGGGGGTLTMGSVLGGVGTSVQIAGGAAWIVGGSSTTGAVVMNQNNTFNGPVTVNNAGLLVTSNLTAIGAAGGLGTGDATNAATNAVSLVLDGGTLRYTGAAVSTDRLFTVGTTAASTIESNGTGALTFNNAGAIGFTGTNAARTLNLSGTNTAANTLASTVGNNGTGATSLNKAGAGTWALTGSNSYTGVTTLTGGTLQFSSLTAGGAPSNIGAAANTAGNIVFNGGTLQYTGAAASTDRLFTINSGTIDSSGSGALNLTSSLALGNGGSNNVRPLVLTGSAGTIAAPNILAASFAATNGSSITKTGAGVWQLSGATAITGNPTAYAAIPQNLPGVVINSGAVIFNNAAAGGAGTVQVNVDNGLLFQAGITTATLQGLSGTGALSLSNLTTAAVAATVGANNANNTYSGVISGLGSISKAGTGQFTLSGLNTYAGTTTVTAGVLNVTNLAPGSSPSSLGQSSSAAANLVLGGGMFRYTGAAAATTDRLFTMSAASILDTGDAGVSFTNTGDIVQGAASLRLDILGYGNSTINSRFVNSTATQIVKGGPNTLTLTAANTFTGGTTVVGGTLNLAFSAATASNILSSGSGLSLNGARLQLTGNPGAANTQTLGAVTLTAASGANEVSVIGNGAASLGLTLGAITRPAGPTLNFATSGGATVSTSTANVNGILGGYATLNGTDWAVGAGTVTAYAAYTPFVTATPIATNTVNNVRVDSTSTGTVSITAGTTDINTLAINDPLNRTVDLAGSTLRLGTAGGILIPAGTGLVTIGAATPGTLTAGGTVANTAGELIFHQYSTSAATVNSVVANNGTGLTTLTKTGTGPLSLAGTNTYTGPTNIFGGTLNVITLNNGAAASQLGASTNAAANLVINGGTLRYAGGAAATTDRLFTVGGNGATLDGSGGGMTLSNAGTLVVGPNSGPRQLTLTGSANNVLTPIIPDQGGNAAAITRVLVNGTGSWTLAGANTFTGGTTVAGGATLNVSTNANLGGVNIGIGGVTLNNGTLGHNGGFISGRTITAAGAAAINTNANSVTYGALAGSGAVSKTGAGSLTLLDGSAYTGTATVSNGTLALNAATLNGAVSVAANATLAINPGLQGQYFNQTPGSPEGSFNSLSTLNAQFSGRLANVTAPTSLAGANLDMGVAGASFPAPFSAAGTNFMARFAGQFAAASAGNYTFFTASDDNTVVFIDGQPVVNNNFGQGVGADRYGTINLTAGQHDIIIGYGQGGGGFGMQIGVQAPGGLKVPLSNGLLSYAGTSSVASLTGPVGSTVALGAGTLAVGDSTSTVFDGVITGGTSGLSADSGGGALVKRGTGTLTLSGTQAYVGSTSVNAGILRSNGSIAASSGVTVSPAAKFVTGSTQTVKSLAIADGGSAELASATLSMLTVGDNVNTTPFSMAGATSSLDMHKNVLIVDYPTGSSPIAAVRASIVSAYSGGTWTGVNGIRSTEVTASTSAAPLLAIGYAEATSLIGGAGTINFGGLTPTSATVDATSLIVRTTLSGDADLDGTVNLNDLIRLANNYGTATGLNWSDGDFDYSGGVDLNDLIRLANNYGSIFLAGEVIPGAGDSFNADLAAAFNGTAQPVGVPEPTTLGLAAIGAAGMLMRRRRRV